MCARHYVLVRVYTTWPTDGPGVVTKINGCSAEGDDDDCANDDDGSTGRNNRNRKHNQKKARNQKRTSSQKNHKNQQGKTYAVKFDDGDFDPGVPASDIRYTHISIDKQGYASSSSSRQVCLRLVDACDRM